MMERYYCESCEMEHFQLIEHLITSIKHLESKAVFLRYSLSCYLPQHKAELLLSDIFSDLSGNCIDYPAYQRYTSIYCGGSDPMDNEEYSKYLTRLSTGELIINL